MTTKPKRGLVVTIDRVSGWDADFCEITVGKDQVELCRKYVEKALGAKLPPEPGRYRVVITREGK